MYNTEISNIDRPLLDWNGFLKEIVTFHELHKDVLEEFTGEEIEIGAMAHKLFMHLCVDYYYATRKRPISNYDLSYKMAEA